MRTDTKIGFIITYFHTSDEGYELFKKNVEILSRENYYFVIASHSPIDKDIQEKCDYYFYQQKNVIDDRKYSHGVAESNLIEMSLRHLKYIGIDWTYKVSYDIEINDVNVFLGWKMNYDFKFVSCNWGSNIICTNSFFSNIDFLLNNITFYKTIDEMFAVNNVLENCWEHDIRSKNLVEQTFAFENKQVFYGVNKIDILYHDYDQINFWYSDEENRFHILNNSNIERAEVRFFDYYTDVCIFIDNDMNLQRGINFWFEPPFSNNIPKSKNGYYMEIHVGSNIIRKNIKVKDFDYKHNLSNKYKLIKNKEVKFNEFSDFDDLSIYNVFNLDINSIRNYVDIGANYGMSSTSTISRGIKTYLVEADSENINILNMMYDRNSNIVIIPKAVCAQDGFIDFWQSPGIGSVVSSIFQIDANGKTDEERIKTTVESISFDNLINNYIEEDYIDLMKVDIEGAEYDIFESVSDESLKKVKRFIIEYHMNDNYKAMDILVKLTKNGFKFKLDKWSKHDGDYVIENKMGVIYAERSI